MGMQDPHDDMNAEGATTAAPDSPAIDESHTRHGEFPDSPVESGPRHPQIPCHLGGRLPRLDQPQRVADLGVGKGLTPPTEVPAGGPAFGHGVGDAFAFDFQFLSLIHI